MKKSLQSIDLLALPFRRVRELRKDERGNVLLLSGIMAFLMTIFAVIAVDTSQAIYNRIIAQNAVDAAADAAALWQARGCNLLQQLNDIHYEGNEIFADTEDAALGACDLAWVAIWIPGAEEFAEFPLCPICRLAKPVNDAQGIFAKIVLGLQEVIEVATPFLAFVAANDAAQGSGADDVFSTGASYINQFLEPFGIQVPSSLVTAVSNMLGWFGLTIYALPIDINSLGLGVAEQEGDNYPWQYPSGQSSGQLSEDAYYASVDVGEFVCQLDPPDGWNDSYYAGHPGYMTWIAGKLQQNELLNLGDLAWLNGNDNASEIQYPFMNQEGPRMYDIGIGGNGNVRVQTATPLVIPAYLAIASSQVQGTPVIAYGSDDARGYLIPVYLPFLNEPGADFWIYH